MGLGDFIDKIIQPFNSEEFQTITQPAVTFGVGGIESIGDLLAYGESDDILVTPEIAYQIPAYATMVQILGDMVGRTHIKIVTDDDEEEEVKPNMAGEEIEQWAYVLSQSGFANEALSRYDWLSWVPETAAVRGNSVTHIMRNPLGLHKIVPVTPPEIATDKRTSRMIWKFGKFYYDGKLYMYEQGWNVPARDIIHVPYKSRTGWWGDNPLISMRPLLARALMTDLAASAAFKGNGSDVTLISVPENMSDAETEKFKKQVNLASQPKAKNRVVAVKGKGDLKIGGRSAADSQLLESRQQLNQEIAARLGGTRMDLGDPAHINYANGANFRGMTHTRMYIPWVERIKPRIDRALPVGYKTVWDVAQVNQSTPLELANILRIGGGNKAWMSLKYMAETWGIPLDEVEKAEEEKPEGENDE